jgi:hypothetical protein
LSSRTCYIRSCVPLVLNQIFERQTDLNNYVFSSASAGNLSCEVLLEIFDSYRQTFQLEQNYERVWNSNKGWFKLIHVCRKWRQVVLTSPARLHVRLFFTEHRPASERAIAIKNLPPLPRIVDIGSRYGETSTTRYRVIAALQYPDRVCRIAISLAETKSKYNAKLWAAMDQPFLALESLELDCKGIREVNLPPPFLSAQTPHLRRLKFTGYTSTLLSRILSRTTSIVDLTLSLDAVFFDPLGTHLLSHLQDMPFLRCLELEMWHYAVGSGEKKDVLLSRLTSFCFKGSISQLEALTADLSAPSLMEFRIARSSPLPPPFSFAVSPTTHLSRFIYTVAKRFFSTQLNAPDGEINLSIRKDSNSDDDQPFRIVASSFASIHSMGYVFCTSLATVQDVFLASPFQPKSDLYSSWHMFLSLFCNAKILRVARGIESEVEAILRPGDGTSASQFLPALEEIELNATTSTPSRIDENELASVFDLFKTFVDARKQAGRPVRVRWNAERVVPTYFCDAEPTVL